MSDTNRRGEIVRDIYDNLTDDEKINYGSFKKKGRPGNQVPN